ncbi:hypothetical protein [Methylobacterium gossipiicola]|uniref:hypothetical protein n=1 Tax=Methylobacterium gossipiicola TaxID=582675 RepID=UPI003CC7A9A2
MADEVGVTVAHDDAAGFADVGPAILPEFATVAADAVEIADVVVVSETAGDVAGPSRGVESIALTAALKCVPAFAILAAVVVPQVAVAPSPITQPRIAILTRIEPVRRSAPVGPSGLWFVAIVRTRWNERATGDTGASVGSDRLSGGSGLGRIWRPRFGGRRRCGWSRGGRGRRSFPVGRTRSRIRTATALFRWRRAIGVRTGRTTIGPARLPLRGLDRAIPCRRRGLPLGWISLRGLRSLLTLEPLLAIRPLLTLGPLLAIGSLLTIRTFLTRRRALRRTTVFAGIGALFANGRPLALLPRLGSILSWLRSFLTGGRALLPRFRPLLSRLGPLLPGLGPLGSRFGAFTHGRGAVAGAFTTGAASTRTFTTRTGLGQAHDVTCPVLWMRP